MLIKIRTTKNFKGLKISWISALNENIYPSKISVYTVMCVLGIHRGKGEDRD